jgi:sulfur-oxidizing protein SoxY
MTRRAMLGTLGAVGVAAAAGVTLAPRAAGAQALGQNEPVDAALKRVFGGKAMKDGSGIIKLDIPLIAENGAVVPVSVEVQELPIPTGNAAEPARTLADPAVNTPTGQWVQVATRGRFGRVAYTWQWQSATPDASVVSGAAASEGSAAPRGAVRPQDAGGCPGGVCRLPGG